jgi:IS605 OrfB family transposase
MAKKSKSSKKHLRTISMWCKSFSAAEKELVLMLSIHASQMYNVSLYPLRQAFINKEKLPSDTELYHATKLNENFSLLLNDCSQQIRRVAYSDMKAFLGGLKAKKNGNTTNSINLPRYKKNRKNNKPTYSNIVIQGRSVRFVKNKTDLEKDTVNRVVINCSKNFKKAYPHLLNKLELSIPKHIKKINEVRILPKSNGEEFKVEVVYEVEEDKVMEDNGRYLSIDLGLNNLGACLNSTNGSSILLDGRYLKSLNQWYNKKVAKLSSKIDLGRNNNQDVSVMIKKKNRLSRNRTNKINDYFHQATNHIVEYCLKNNLNTIVVGENKEQKQSINIGSVNNQNFVSVPFFKFKNMLEYKAKSKGLLFAKNEESYTSKTSFLDLEEVKKHKTYVGTRTKRGLFKSSLGLLLNADVNGAGNILRKWLKSRGNFEIWRDQYFKEASRGIVNCPKKITLECLHASIGF